MCHDGTGAGAPGTFPAEANCRPRSCGSSEHLCHDDSSSLHVSVPSPLAGEGQGEGAQGSATAGDTPHPDLPPQGGKGPRHRIMFNVDHRTHTRRATSTTSRNFASWVASVIGLPCNTEANPHWVE